MTKHSRSRRSHTDSSSSSSSFIPRCSCGNPGCEMMEIVRLLAETTDNYLLLQARCQMIEQHALPLLEEIHQGQRKSLERWQIELDIYLGHMLHPARPTMRWQASPEEEPLARKRRWATEWFEREQQQLQEHLLSLQEAMQRHEAYLEARAARFVSAGLRPDCIPGIAAVVQERLARVEAHHARLDQQYKRQRRQISELHTQYQQEQQRLQQADQQTNTQLALGRKGATTQWVVQNLFGVGTPQSLSLTNRVSQQLEASSHYQTHKQLQAHFFWYCERSWQLRSDLPSNIQVLSGRWVHWKNLLDTLDRTSDPNTVLLALASH